MRHVVLAGLALILTAAPAVADLNVVYKGTESFDGKDSPAEARYSVTRGRVAIVQKGTHSGRMLFDRKAGVMRFVDDVGKTYVDMDRQTIESFQSGAASARAEMDKAMAQMSPEQRKMVEGMMQGRMAQTSQPPDEQFVRTEVTANIKGYDCTRVDVLRGQEKRAEYWGTPSKDFQMSPEERQTMLDMQAYLGRFVTSLSAATGTTPGARGFHWDTKMDGYPIVTRCFDGERKILDLTMDSFNHDAISEDLFKIPGDYKKQDISAMGKPEREGRLERTGKRK